MNIEELREFCISKAGVSEHFPFDEETLVFKVLDKMFLLVDINSNPISFNVKCEPEKAIELREKHSFITPGYHMNKKHWNTITVDDAKREFILEQINHSYDCVVKSLTKKQKAELNNLSEAV